MILKELSEHNNKWGQIALNVCNDYDLAQDLVQEMYLKLMNRTKWNDYFVAITIRNLFIDKVRKKKDVRLQELHYLQDQSRPFEPNDEQQAVLNEFYKLDWVQQELLLERMDRSLRDIEKIYNINYGYVHRQVKQAKEQILNNVNYKR